MKSIFLSVAILMLSSFAEAGTFCVGNFGGGDLAWALRDGKKVVFATMAHGIDQQWRCVDIDDTKTFEVEVAPAERMDSEPACVYPVKHGEWVAARDIETKAGDDLQCEHYGPTGKMNDGKERLWGSTEPYVLEGFVTGDGPIANAIVLLRDSYGAVVARGETGALGSFSIPVKTPNLKGYYLETMRGTQKGKPFLGNLMRTIDDEFQIQRDSVRLNIGSTLAARARIQFKTTHAAASEEIRRYLDLGPNTDLDITEAQGIRLFSAAVFNEEARRYGGWDKMMTLIARDLEQGGVVRPFRGVQLLKFILKPMIVGIVEKASYVIFGKVLDQIGLADGGTQALRQLEIVSAQLAEIRARLDGLKLQLTELEYTLRVTPINKCYGDILLYVKRLHDQTLITIDRGNQPGDLISLAQLRSDMGTKIKEAGESCVTDIHHLFNPELDGVDPFQQVWARAADMKQGAIVRPQYFADVEDHVGRFNMIQAYIASLLIDIFNNTPNKEADAKWYRDTVIDWVTNKQVRVLPNSAPYNKPETVKLIENKEAFYQRNPERLWSTKIARYPTIEQYRSQVTSQRAPFLVDTRSFRELIWQTDMQDTVIEKAMINWGFDKDVAAQTKMIMLSGALIFVDGRFGWMGNDQKSGADPYWDNPAQYYNVMNQKKIFPGFHVLEWNPAP